MFHALIVGLPLLFLGGASEKQTDAERLKVARKEAADARAALDAACRQMPDPSQPGDAVKGLFDVWIAKQSAGLALAWEIAVANPDSDAGLDALEWVLSVPGLTHRPYFKQALALVEEHYVTSPKAARLIASLAYWRQSDDGPLADLLKTVAAKNQDWTVRGQLALGQAHLLKWQYEWAAYTARADAGRLAVDAERAFAAVLKDYDECPNLHNPRGGLARATIGEEARAELFELRHIIVGCPAPDIEGEDLTGAKFKLSDYRGKVVVLVFWATWCPLCLRDIPHERELLEHFKGRPFAVVGVNGDYKKQQAIDTVAKREITWRSFWNGPEGAEGPVSAAFSDRGWPWVCVIDHQGIIRTTYLRGKQLDEPLEGLVRQAEMAAK
jgi:thiol-disulfide isomerase/thioredoxin